MSNILKPAQLAAVCSKAGFKGGNLIIAVAVALAESGGNADAIGDKGMSFGLFQINAHAHPDLIPGWSSVDRKLHQETAWNDPYVNAGFAFKISGGAHWGAWSTYMHGTFKNKIPEAMQGVDAFINSSGPVTPDKPKLIRGSIGPIVKELQTILNKADYTPVLEVDGEFGPLTLAAVKWFQTKMKIEVDGIVGPITWGKLSTV
jgi:hypothetical protein